MRAAVVGFVLAGVYKADVHLIIIVAPACAFTSDYLETPYSRLPNINHSAINGKDLGISAIVTERQQQLDAVLNG
ncbi:hypothetical protein EDB19DRAFT_1917774 [Suillus lakei]|nr:hypothetical protein EDB19DRAFT_1963665 [Suillus lakei]KAG1720758.1 hypothetical protein EDB19DRAFT_1917774 [Suillus lakei]